MIEEKNNKQKSSLITVKSVMRSKGFLDENISVKKYNPDDLSYIFDKVSYVKNNIDQYNLSLRNIKIINKIYLSYEKALKKISIDEDEMILKKHENIEIKKISKKNLARYFIYRYKFNIYPKLQIIDDYPPCIQIEPTSICNYRCVMCYQADKTFSNKSGGFMGHMKLDLFKSIIDQASGNIEAVTLASRGEPTLNPNFSEMISYADNKFLALKINTNASMLNEKLIHHILSSNIQTIVFSIDAKDKEAYEKIRINGNFEKITKNLDLFNNIRNKEYSREDKVVRISGVKINEEQDIEEMKKKWGDIADIVAFTNYTPWESSYENEINNIDKACSELWSRMFIWQDGKVNPCDYDYKSKLSQWNILDQTITNIWNSEEYNFLRYSHQNKLRTKIEPCKRCINS